MITEVTEGILVGVETFYQQQHSDPQLPQYMFAYRIRIENHSSHVVQLLRRHWFITDALNNRREVEGEGVIGQQPVLKPNETYEYVSGCDFPTEIGKMEGTYLMQRTSDKTEFHVKIPAFIMAVPYKQN